MTNHNVQTKPSVELFKTPEIFSAARATLLAEVNLAAVREKIKPIQDAVIAGAGLKMNLTDNSPITDMKDTYLSTDEAAVAKMYDEYKHAIRRDGRFGITEAQIEEGFCPELMAENLLRMAENLLIDRAGAIVGIRRPSLTLELRKQFLELTLRMIVNLPGFTVEIPKPSALGG